MAPVLPPSPRPDDWKSAAPAPPAGTKTFAAQPTLPRLPVPPLDQTLASLKASLAPLAHDEAELRAAVGKIDRFKDGVGKVLQGRLEEHARGKEHWLEKWWDDGAYLGYRDSVIVNVSYYYGFKDVPNTPTDPVHRAAALVRASMLFRRMLKLGQVPAEDTKEGPFCMDTYRWMFDCARVPARPLDWSVSYARPTDTGDEGHIIVVRDGRFWRVAVSSDNTLLSTSDIERQLRRVVEHSAELGPGPGVGVLSASDRDNWADDYVELANDTQNRDALREIHSAAFVLALDASSPADDMAESRELWHGAFKRRDRDGRVGLEDRWSDKPINLVVFANGRAGIMGEHSVMDGTPTVTFCDVMLDMLASPSFDHGSASATASALEPKPLDFVVSTKTKDAIASARVRASELIESQAMGIARTAYGKRAIKAFGVSPDSWAQMVVQLAYARLLRATGKRREGGTYEAATTRRFLHGRTETIRVVSKESDAFVAAMDDPAASAETKKAKMRDAAQTHIRLAKEAGAARGVDRHILGLKMVKAEGDAKEADDVFGDALVKRGSYWALSTSAVFSKHFGTYGWGEVVPDGFGVAYMTGFDDYLQYTITSRTEMPNAEFVAEIQRAARDMYDIFGGASEVDRSGAGAKQARL